MARTVMYAFHPEGAEKIGFTNAWQGAMYVWNQVTRDYLDLTSLPRDPKGQRAVWGAAASDTIRMNDTDAFVLMSTLDRMLLEPDRIPDAAAHFHEYGRRHPDSNFTHQAAALLRIAERWPGYLLGVGWNQNDFSPTPWEVAQGFAGQVEFYAPRSGTTHIPLYETWRQRRKAQE